MRYDFFFPVSNLNRRNAIQGVVAGSIAGGFLTMIGLLKTAIWFLLGGRYLQDGLFFALATIFSMLITLLTWKRIVMGPVLGFLASVVLVVLALRQGLFVQMGLLGPILLGGFCSAARGISFLSNLNVPLGREN